MPHNAVSGMILYDQLHAMTAMIQASAFFIPYGGCNDHGGSTGSGYNEVHGGCGYDTPVPDIESFACLI